MGRLNKYTCKHCDGLGFLIDATPLDAQQVLDSLRADLRRKVYAGRDGVYYIEYNGGFTTRETIQVLVDERLITLKYPERPEIQVWRLVA